MNDKTSENPQDIPEKTEEVLKAMHGHLEALTILQALLLDRVTKREGTTAEAFLQQLEKIQETTKTTQAGYAGRDDWRFRAFEIGFSNTLVKIRGYLRDLF